MLFQFGMTPAEVNALPPDMLEEIAARMAAEGRINNEEDKSLKRRLNNINAR